MNMNSATEHYLHQHQAVAGALPGGGLDWLQARRDGALARFEEVGFPTQRDEDWKYTNVKPITAKPFLLPEPLLISEPMSIAPLVLRGADQRRLKSHLLVFCDGVFSLDHSQFSGVDEGDTAGVTIAPLAKVLDERPEMIEAAFGKVMPKKPHGFTALNESFNRDGAVIIIEENATPTAPIELLFVSRAPNGLSQPRNLIIANANSKAAVIERHVSIGDHSAFTNSATEILLGEQAELDYYLMQMQSAAAYHICGMWAKQARASRFSCRTVTLGGALVRNDLSVELAGEHAHCDMLGLYNIAGRQHVDNHTTMLHAAENCSSRELYKGVLDGRSRAVFHGRIVVAQDAQKTNAAQTNNNLLLSRGAEIDTKPQLEIYADDVKCSHGATVGQIDADALFYLRSRGIGEAEARELLTFAFVNDVVDEIEISELKEALSGLLAQRLTDQPATNGKAQ